MSSRPRDADRILLRIAEGQFGLFNLTQALAAGHTRSSIARGVAVGRFIRVLPRVYAIAGTPRSWHREAMAAHLWAGEGSAIAFQAAARAWRLDGFAGAPVELSTTRGKRADVVPFKCHRVSRFLVPEIESIGPLPVTSVRRTLLDLAGIKHRRVESALDQALFQRLTSLGQMWLLYEEEWTRGRRGIAILRALLAERTPGLAPTQGDLERLMMKIVRDFGLPIPERQYPIELPFGVIHADFCYPAARLVIETDGYAAHGDRTSFDNDRERDNELRLQEWIPLRFTWAQLRWRREWVAQTILAHLAMSDSYPAPSVD